MSAHTDNERSEAAVDVPRFVREIELMGEVVDAAKCIRHWHDSGEEGMVVSKEHVFKLWQALNNLEANTQAHPPPPVDPRFARFGEAMWEYIAKRSGDFCRDENSEDILPLAEAAGLCCRVKYDPEIHGDMIDAEPGCEIWWWGNF